MDSLTKALLVFIAATVVDARGNARCHSTELCFLRSNQRVEFHCNCNDSSTNCSWSKFANSSVHIGRSLSPSEAVLSWDRSIGYGQYICIRDHSIEAKDVLILSPLEESCEKCISTRVCKNNTGTYLRFSKHYKPSLSMVPCDLYLNNDMVQSSITEEMFVEISPQSNYSIRCPICDHEIYYEIPHFTFFNIPYCSIVTDSVTSISSSISMSSNLVLTSTSHSITITIAPTNSDSLIPFSSPFTSFLVSSSPILTSPSLSISTAITPTNSGGSSTTNGNNITGRILGGVFGGIGSIAVIIIITALIIYCSYIRSKKKHASLSINDGVASNGAVNEMQSAQIEDGDEVDSERQAANANKTTNNEEDKECSRVQEKVRRLLLCYGSCLSDAITRNNVIINKHINFKTLIQFLHKYKVFTRDEMEYFSNSNFITAEKVTKLIEWIPTKDENGIRNFVRALSEAHEHSGHNTILEHLYDIAFAETPV